MLSRRGNGFGSFAQLRDEMDRLMGGWFGPKTEDWFGPTLPGLATGVLPTRWPVSGRGFPALNVWEDGENLFAEAEVPGLKSEDVDISVVGSDLTVRGRRAETAPEGVTYHRHERGAGEFNRVLRLPVEVDASKVEASLHDGVLLIKLPKAEGAKPKKIKVLTS